jgi:hypothetical protein
MPVTEREIVQSCLSGARGIDRISRFAASFEIDDGAMCKANPERARRSHRGVHPCGNIIELTFPEERRWQKESIVIERERRRREVKVYVRWQPELCDAIPHALRTMRIVVSRQQVPVNVGKWLHALDRRTQCVWIGCLAVVNIAGNDDVMNAIAYGMCSKTLDGHVASSAIKPSQNRCWLSW